MSRAIPGTPGRGRPACRTTRDRDMSSADSGRLDKAFHHAVLQPVHQKTAPLTGCFCTIADRAGHPRPSQNCCWSRWRRQGNARPERPAQGTQRQVCLSSWPYHVDTVPQHVLTVACPAGNVGAGRGMVRLCVKFYQIADMTKIRSSSGSSLESCRCGQLPVKGRNIGRLK